MVVIDMDFMCLLRFFLAMPSLPTQLLFSLIPIRYSFSL